MRPAFGRRTLFVSTKQIRTQLAEMLQDELGQQLAGTLLAAGALCAHLARRGAAEAREAAYLLDMLKNVNRELNCLIANLDGGHARFVASREGKTTQ
jgi:signal transduction histidine kinase